MKFNKIGSALILLMICAIIALSGCTGGQSQPQQGAMEAKDTQAATTEPVTTEPQETVKAQTPVQEPVKAAGKALKDLLAGKLTKYTADYDLTAQGTSFSMTIASDLPKMAISSTIKGTESKSIVDTDKVYSCIKSSGSWQCFEIKMNATEQDKIEGDVKSGKAESTYTGTCTAAGETGSEYDVKSTNGEQSTLCYTSDGIVLKMVTKATTMTAIKVTRSVASDAFTLPAEPQDMAALQAKYANMYQK